MRAPPKSRRAIEMYIMANRKLQVKAEKDNRIEAAEMYAENIDKMLEDWQKADPR